MVEPGSTMNRLHTQVGSNRYGSTMNGHVAGLDLKVIKLIKTIETIKNL